MYEQLLDEGMDAMLGKRFADAHAVYLQALRLRPQGPDVGMIQANVERLEKLMGSTVGPSSSRRRSA